jgi:hypothetical protein
MKISLWGILPAAMLVSIVGCHQASSPASVQNNVTSAREQAEKNDVKAAQNQAQKDAAANADAAEAAQKADSKKADTAYDLSVTEAEGRHKIAIEKCNALAGDSQKACKEQADAALELAKANANAARAAGHS